MLIMQARGLALALGQRHREAPFDLVQSADYEAAGLFVPRKRSYVHVIRCSLAADLYDSADGVSGSWRPWLELQALRRGDHLYAPSQLIADHLRKTRNLSVRVVRPPIAQLPNRQACGVQLPSRYLLHFGLLRRRKGTEWLAEALRHAWQTCPDLTMVWAGVCNDRNLVAFCRDTPEARAGTILWTGPLDRRQLASVIAGAEAAVLPSLVDNLPNTVLESLCSGIPVIGSRGASIDELVEDGRTGYLVNIGDVKGLAQAMIRVWSGDAPVRKGFTWQGAAAIAMRPETAIANLLALARRAN